MTILKNKKKIKLSASSAKHLKKKLMMVWYCTILSRTTPIKKKCELKFSVKRGCGSNPFFLILEFVETFFLTYVYINLTYLLYSLTKRETKQFTRPFCCTPWLRGRLRSSPDLYVVLINEEGDHAVHLAYLITTLTKGKTTQLTWPICCTPWGRKTTQFTCPICCSPWRRGRPRSSPDLSYNHLDEMEDLAANLTYLM